MAEEGGTLVGGRYRLVSRIGSGGMGTVWRAEDTLLGRAVAVKSVDVPPGTPAAEAAVLHERTRREARAAARLHHPNAVTVFDVVEQDGRPWLVLELVEAPTLAEVVRRDGPLAPERAARVGLALLSALEAAHERGIVHRDVKPGNVLLVPARGDRPERAVLTDFGIATATGDSSLTSSGLMLGSPAYISPERLRGDPPGPPADLWSLGATLFAAVEGRAAFTGDAPLVVVSAVASGEHAAYSSAGALAPVLDGLLETDPDRRLDAAGARVALQRVADGAPAPTRPVTAPVPAPVPEPAPAPLVGGTAALDAGELRRVAAPRAPGRGGRRGAVAAAVVGVLLVAGLGTGLALSRGGDDPSASGGAPSPTPSATPPAAPSAAPSTTPAPARSASAAPSSPAATGAVPAGWRTVSGKGWTAAVPPEWAGDGTGNPAELRDPATGRTLRVETGKGKDDAVQDRREQADAFAKKHPTYQEIGIQAVDYRGLEAADWEFTYEGLHVLDRVFVVDGRGWSLFFQTPAADWPAGSEQFQQVLAAFRPTGGED